MPTLPIELVDRILSYLPPPFEYLTLCFCSLVCRKWTYSAQRLLFLELKLKSHQLRDFMRVLRTSPYLGPHVELLDLEDSPRDRKGFSFSDLVALVGELPRLRHLRMRQCVFLGDSINVTPCSSATLYKVTYIQGSYFLRKDPLVIPTLGMILKTFPAVSVLRIAIELLSGDATRREAFSEYSDSLGVKLSSLSLNATYPLSKALFEATTRARMLDNLISLDLIFKTQVNETALFLASVLSNRRCVLRRLSLRTHNYAFADTDFPTLATSVALRLLPALRGVHTLRTFALVVSAFLHTEPFCAHIAFPLLQALPPTVTALHLYIESYNVVNNPPMDRNCAVLRPYVDLEQVKRSVEDHAGITDVYIHKTRLKKVSWPPLECIAANTRLHVDNWDWDEWDSGEWYGDTEL